MELTCNIIKCKEDFNKYEHILNVIKDFDIKRHITRDSKEFIYNIQQYRPHFDNYAQHAFTNHDGDLGYAMLMTYYISAYSDTIFTIKTNFENKLIRAANQIVSYFEEDKKNYDSEFYNIIDYYYSVYKIWSSPDISVINKIYDKLIDACIEYRINECSDYKISHFIKRIFIINNKMATKTLLQNYPHFINIPVAQNIIWTCINNIKDENLDHIVLIMIAELRIHIIPKLHTSTDRKDIYYKIDIENIIKLIRNNKFNCEKLDPFLNIFVSKINKSNNKNIQRFKKKCDNLQEYYIEIVDLFKQMYDIICV